MQQTNLFQLIKRKEQNRKSRLLLLFKIGRNLKISLITKPKKRILRDQNQGKICAQANLQFRNKKKNLMIKLKKLKFTKNRRLILAFMEIQWLKT